jgi:hypothetical protein
MSTPKEIGHLRAVEQAQQSLEFAAVAWGGVELEGKSASIKSISECIQSSNAISFSSCILRCSAAGSRRQLSIRKNERKGDNDEANNTTNDGFQQSFAIGPKPPPGRLRIHAWRCPSERAAMATPCCGCCMNRTSPHRGWSTP